MTATRSYLAMGAFAMAGNTPLVVQPMVVGAMVDRLGLTERQAGLLASLELAGLTLGILALMGVMGRVPRSTLAVLALLTIVAANLLTCLVSAFAWLVPIRMLSGVGAAAAFCVYLSMAAASPMPERVFAVVNAISIAYSGILTLLAPRIMQFGGLNGMLLTLAGITLLALATIPLTRESNLTAARPVGRLQIGAIPQSVLVLLAMMLLLYTGHGAIWAFQERIGIAAGLSEHAVGKWIGLSMLVWGVGGSLLARVMGMSIGRIWPQILSLGASCIAVLFLVFGSSPAAFATSCGLIAFSWFYGLPYQMGLLAARDAKGRAALAGVMMSTAGMAIGPGISALLLVGHAHWPIGVFAGTCYLLALAIAVPAARGLAPAAQLRAA
jgi:predicted MFS family arabinose efflux permease